MDDELNWQADRANLHRLKAQHSDWSLSQLAQALNRSRGWVKKWLRRFRQASQSSNKDKDKHDPLLFLSHSRARKQPLPPPNPLIEERILAIRDNPPDNLGRTPGPRTIGYYLAKDPLLLENKLRAPTSTSTIHKILLKNGRIAHLQPHSPKPMELPPPLTSWQLDFKDAAMVKIGPEGKQAHFVEILNVLDVGTSILVDTVASDDFNAETSLAAVADILKQHGLPKSVTFDRDPRWVGSHSGRDFPAAFVKFWYCLGVKPNICPPHRPDLNAVVERYHRSLGQECLKVKLPSNLAEVKELLPPYKQHYNHLRPHQGRACNNLPPRVAFPDSELPVLPGLPLIIDPDRWLRECNGLRFVRKVDYKGTVKIDKHHYYLRRELRGKYVMVEIDGTNRQLIVSQGKSSGSPELKRLEIKGLYGQEMTFEDYLKVIMKEARSERRLAMLKARNRVIASAA